MKPFFRSAFAPVFVTGAIAASSLAFAADPPLPAGPSEPIACDGQKQDAAACRREAGAARDEARHGGLTSPTPADEQKNALERCKAQPPRDQNECEARVRGTGNTSTEGSVMDGGVLRETVTPVPVTHQ